MSHTLSVLNFPAFVDHFMVFPLFFFQFFRTDRFISVALQPESNRTRSLCLSSWFFKDLFLIYPKVIVDNLSTF